MTNDETIRGAAAAISATLSAALSDPEARWVTLTRDEALQTLGLVDGIGEMLDRPERRV